MRAAAAVVLLGCTVPLLGSKTAFAELERHIFDLVNKQRHRHGVAELKWNRRLAEEAHRHALNMAGRRFFSHADPLRGDLAARLREDRIPWRRCAENLFEEQGYADPARQAIAGWLHSPGHRRNMLDKTLTETGVGVAVRGDGSYLVAQDFIRP